MAKIIALLLVCFATFGQTLSVINTGTTSNDGTGDSLRTAFTKANTNFYQLWSEVFTNIPVDITNSVAVKLDATNGTAVNLTGSLTNATLWTTNDVRVGTTKSEALQLRNLQTDSRFWLYLTNADTSPQIVLTATPDTDDPTGLGASTLDDRLKAWTSGQAYQVTAATYDSDGVVTTATVSWPDGSAGTFTRTTKNTTFLAVDAFTITHTASGKTVTQPAVTRDDFGAVTTKPALTVS